MTMIEAVKKFTGEDFSNVTTIEKHGLLPINSMSNIQNMLVLVNH